MYTLCKGKKMEWRRMTSTPTFNQTNKQTVLVKHNPNADHMAAAPIAITAAVCATMYIAQACFLGHVGSRAMTSGAGALGTRVGMGMSWMDAGT